MTPNELHLYTLLKEAIYDSMGGIDPERRQRLWNVFVEEYGLREVEQAFLKQNQNTNQ